MFAKVFGQIFDSSIAEDYNCRRMFMDLLVLADPTGAVDMTDEAIARRTNVPLPEVQKYLSELQQPDPSSRSKKSDGRRIIALDSTRSWGWQIVNHQHYRDLRDAETLRLYFRDAQRRSRKKKKQIERKKKAVKDSFDTDSQILTPASASASKSTSKERESEGKPKRGKARANNREEVAAYCTEQGLSLADANYCWNKWESNGWTIGGKAIRDWQAAIRSWQAAGYLPVKGHVPIREDPKMTRLRAEIAASRARLQA